MPEPDRAHDDRVARLEEENQALHEQVKELVRTERRLYRTRNQLDRQLSILNHVNRFALAASAAEDAHEVAALGLDLLTGIYAFERGIALCMEDPPDQATVAGRHGAGTEPSGSPEQDLELAPGIVTCLEQRPEPYLVGPASDGPDAVLFDQAWDLLDQRTGASGGRGDPAEDALVLVLPLHLPGMGPSAALILGRRSRSTLSYHEHLPSVEDAMVLDLLQGNITAALENRALYSELDDAARTLEAKVASRTEELSRSNAELDQFAYVASHDLQEPLRMVRSYVELLDRRMGDRLTEEEREFMGFIQGATGRMQELLKGLLAYARVQREPLAPEATDTQAVLDEVLNSLRLTLEERCAEVICDGPLPVVQANRAHLAQVLQNLISNGLKFSEAPVPQVRVSAVPTEEGWRFQISDNGIGMDPEQADRAFMMFQRLHGRNHYPGTGIGLAICKRIVQRHGGEIWMHQGPPDDELPPSDRIGSTFCFTLPRQPERGQDAAPPEPTGQRSGAPPIGRSARSGTVPGAGQAVRRGHEAPTASDEQVAG